MPQIYSAWSLVVLAVRATAVAHANVIKHVRNSPWQVAPGDTAHGAPQGGALLLRVMDEVGPLVLAYGNVSCRLWTTMASTNCLEGVRILRPYLFTFCL